MRAGPTRLHQAPAEAPDDRLATERGVPPFVERLEDDEHASDVADVGAQQRGVQINAQNFLLQNAIKQYSVGASLAASQGDLASALDLVDRAVKTQFTPLEAQLSAKQANLVFVHPSVQAKTLAELLAVAKNAKLAFASPGSGSACAVPPSTDTFGSRRVRRRASATRSPCRSARRWRSSRVGIGPSSARRPTCRSRRLPRCRSRTRRRRARS